MTAQTQRGTTSRAALDVARSDDATVKPAASPDGL
jgi:hypothetical protein